MMLKMIQEIEIETKKPTPKKCERCPACSCGDLIVVGADHLCSKCDWLNSLALVNSGHIDNIEVACKNHFSSKIKVRIQKAELNKPELGADHD